MEQIFWHQCCLEDLFKATATHNAKLRRAVLDTPLKFFPITIRVLSPRFIGYMPASNQVQLDENEILTLVLNFFV